MTRTRLFAAVAATGLLGLAAIPAWAQMFEKITIVNSTGYTINEVYVTPSNERTWQEDVMARDTLPDGQEVEIDFRRSENSCNWDLMVVYSDGEEAVWNGLNLCQDWHYELFYNARSGETKLVSSN